MCHCPVKTLNVNSRIAAENQQAGRQMFFVLDVDGVHERHSLISPFPLLRLYITTLPINLSRASTPC